LVQYTLQNNKNNNNKNIPNKRVNNEICFCFLPVLACIHALRNIILYKRLLLKYLETGTTVEYCQWEMLNASCPADQVLVFTSARYGRMQIGRCVTKNYGFIGCSVDVFQHLNTLCSGRHNCRFLVPDETLREVQPCPKDFASYLRITYHCVTGSSTSYNKLWLISSCNLKNRQLINLS